RIVGAQRHELRVGEAEHPRHGKGDGQPDGHEGEEAAVQEARQERCGQFAEECHGRITHSAPTFGNCSGQSWTLFFCRLYCFPCESTAPHGRAVRTSRRACGLRAERGRRKGVGACILGGRAARRSIAQGGTSHREGTRQCRNRRTGRTRCASASSAPATWALSTPATWRPA